MPNWKSIASLASGLLLTVGMSVDCARAQSAVTYVSNVGNNVNDCAFPGSSRACDNFQRAHDNTIVGGTIICVDSYDFGPVTITKSITIECVGQAARARTIVINAPNSIVTLRGLVIPGHYG